MRLGVRPPSKRWRADAWIALALLVVLATWVGWSGSQPPSVAQSWSRAEVARALEAPEPGRPPGSIEPTWGPGHAVSLPHGWDDLSPPWTGLARYTLSWPEDATPIEVGGTAVLLERVGVRYRLLFNGVHVAERGWNAAGTVDVSAAPHLVVLPPELFRTPLSANRLMIDVAGEPLRRSGLAPVTVGPVGELEWCLASSTWWQVHFPWMVMAYAALIGGLSFLMWAHDRERLFALGAAATLCWAVFLTLRVSLYVPLSYGSWLFLERLAFTGYCAALFLFLSEAYGVNHALLRRSVWAVLALSPFVLGLGVWQASRAWLVAWNLVIAVQCAVFLVLWYRSCRHLPQGAWRAMWGVCLINVLAGVRDLGVRQWDWPGDPQRQWLVGASLLFLIALGWLKAQRISAFLLSTRDFARALEQRVRDREGELRLAFDRLRDAERRQVLEDERRRLTRDMHDGLGSQLVQTLNVVRTRGVVDPAVIEGMLNHALEELRITLDSLEPMEGDLPAILGTLRARIAPALDAAGIELDWQVEEVPPITVRGQALESRGVMHLFRCLQEVVANVVQHARARRVTVRTWVENGHTMLAVIDDGVGLGPGERPGGRGLNNIRVRAAEIGAQVAFRRADEGTVVEFRFGAA